MLMKLNFIFGTFFILLIFLSCKSQNSDGVFYNENNTNRTKGILTYNNYLYILGQHNFTDKDVERTSTVLCIDTSFKKIWDIHLGDSKTDERFVNFAIDKQGNLYITGHNSITKSALLIKTNSTGQTIWRKEFKDINGLNEIKLINDTSIIVAGTYLSLNPEITRDIAFVQKIDSSGIVIWRTPISNDGGLRFLELLDGKIIFCLNAGIFNGFYPNSKFLILDQNGVIKNNIDLDLESTGIELGVKVVQLKITSRNKIAILCHSHNNRNIKMQLIQFENNGNKLSTLKYGDKNQEIIYSPDDKLFINSGLNISGEGIKASTIVINENKEQKLYFTQSDKFIKTKFTGSIILNNTLYTIGDIFDLEKNTAMWKVEKCNR